MWPQTKAWFQAKHCWYITCGTIGSFRGEPVHYSSSWETTEELQHLVTDALWPITYISQTDGQHIHTANFFLCSVHFHILGFFSTIPIHCTQVSLFFFLACGCLLKQGNTLCFFWYRRLGTIGVQTLVATPAEQKNRDHWGCFLSWQPHLWFT